jgi:hypothetical protein
VEVNVLTLCNPEKLFQGIVVSRAPLSLMTPTLIAESAPTLRLVIAESFGC